MKTILIFTRGTNDDEFDHWYDENHAKITDVERSSSSNRVYIAKYSINNDGEKHKEKEIIICRVGSSSLKKIVSDYLERNKFENPLILYHNHSDYFLDLIKSLPAIKHKSYSTKDNNIHLPPPTSIDDSSWPLDKLLDSVQKKENAYDFSKAFDEVWNSFVISKRSAVYEFIWLCKKNEKPSDLSLLVNAGIDVNSPCKALNAKDRTITQLFDAFVSGNLSWNALKDGIHEKAEL